VDHKIHNIINLLSETFFRRQVVVTDESGAGAESGFFGKGGFLTLLLLKLFSWPPPRVFLFHQLSFPLPEDGEPFFAQPSLLIIPDYFTDSKAFNPPPLCQTVQLLLLHLLDSFLIHLIHQTTIRNEAEIKVLVLNRGYSRIIVRGDLDTLQAQKKDFCEMNVVESICDMYLICEWGLWRSRQAVVGGHRCWAGRWGGRMKLWMRGQAGFTVLSDAPRKPDEQWRYLRPVWSDRKVVT
jgi:hypothetical protein